jgi:hypothetical protein
MFRPPQHRPGPEKILEFRAKAKVLGLNLQHERASLAARQGCDARMKDIYDAVYLPTAVTLADGLTSFDIPDLELLRQPFCPELASIQLTILIGLLHTVTAVLGELEF